MTFSSYDETDDIEETDDFDDESQDSYLDEEDDDVVDLEDEEEDDLDDAATALSRAFREAAGADTVEDDADEKEDSAEEADDDDAEAAEQLLAEAIDALPDEEDLEVVTPPLEDPSLEDLSLEDPSLEVGFLRPQEQDNLAYADAVTAYYEDKDYQRAIEKFGEAIENEIQHTEGNVTNSSSIVVKAMYWQAEAYVKMQDISQAIVTFENLIQTYQEHYLSLAAQRRTAQLNPK